MQIPLPVCVKKICDLMKGCSESIILKCDVFSKSKCNFSKVIVSRWTILEIYTILEVYVVLDIKKFLK